MILKGKLQGRDKADDGISCLGVCRDGQPCIDDGIKPMTIHTCGHSTPDCTLSSRHVAIGMHRSAVTITQSVALLLRGRGFSLMPMTTICDQLLSGLFHTRNPGWLVFLHVRCTSGPVHLLLDFWSKSGSTNGSHASHKPLMRSSMAQSHQ